MMENDFKVGDLIIPNDSIENAFFYKIDMELPDGYTYRVATDSEMIYYRKYILSNMVETSDVNKYLQEKRKYAGEISKQESKETQDLLNKINLANSYLR